VSAGVDVLGGGVGVDAGGASPPHSLG
jgi:hypothetical protein